jgi:hypothetical protein
VIGLPRLAGGEEGEMAVVARRVGEALRRAAQVEVA